VDDFKAASMQAWSAVAPDWGELIARVDRQLEPAVDWMIEAADPQPGETVLELAGGPGTVSLIAARRVGESGRVIHTDFSAAMVDTARARIAAEAEHQNIESRVMDAEAIDLPDRSVDVVLCRMGYMLMGDPGKAIAESARVLKAGGRLALAVWDDDDANPWATVPMRAVMEHLGAPPPPPDAPTLWSLADPDRLTRLLSDAGLTAVQTTTLDGHVEYESAEEVVELIGRLAGPAKALIGSLEPAARQAIAERVDRETAAYRHDGRLLLPERIRVASAHRA